jgi:hypothetical protein
MISQFKKFYTKTDLYHLVVELDSWTAESNNVTRINAFVSEGSSWTKPMFFHIGREEIIYEEC